LRRRRLRVLLLALALASGASGCTASNAGSGTTPPTNSGVFKRGGTVDVAVPSLPSNFNPSTPGGANRITAEVMAQVWPQTFVTDDRLETTAEAGFVEDAEVESISPFKVVYTLNPKAVWSDGVPIGVDDFIYNWHEQLLWGSRLPDSGLLAGYQAISSITSPDGGSIVDVTFSHSFSEWESLFSDLVPAHIGERYGWVDAFEGFDSAKVVSGGPFEITSFVPGVRLVLSRNPRYWFTPARLSHIVLEVQSSPEVLRNLQAGAVEVAQVPDSEAVDGVIANAARTGTALTAITSELPTLWQLCFNTTAFPVDSAKFRIGIAESLYAGEVTDDSVGLVDASAAPYASRLVLEAGSQPGGGTSGAATGSGSGGAGSGGGIGDYDPLAALHSFRSAGYIPGAGGALRAGGTGPAVTLSLLVPTRDIAVEQAASVVQAELNDIGIRVVLRPTPLNTMLATKLPMGEYQMALAPFLLTTFAAAQVPVYSGSVLPNPVAPSPADRGAVPITEGDGSADVSGIEPGAVVAGAVTRDISGLNDTIVAADLSQALTNLNPADDLTLIDDADNELWLDMPTIPLFQEPIDVVHPSDLRGVSESPTWEGVFWNAQAWEIQESPRVVPITATSSAS
jgi:peptide/nickel transport system substrate-binding protein